MTVIVLHAGCVVHKESVLVITQTIPKIRQAPTVVRVTTYVMAVHARRMLQAL